jgi:hypothetical protein
MSKDPGNYLFSGRNITRMEGIVFFIVRYIRYFILQKQLMLFSTVRGEIRLYFIWIKYKFGDEQQLHIPTTQSSVCYV